MHRAIVTQDHQREEPLVEGRRTTDAAGEMRDRSRIEDDLKAETASLEATGDPATETFDRVSVKAKRANVAVKLVCLLWT